MGVLRHELPDQQVLDHPIIANGPIAPLVTMTCRLLPHRVASRGVLPRERFSPVAQLRPQDLLYAFDDVSPAIGRGTRCASDHTCSGRNAALACELSPDRFKDFWR